MSTLDASILSNKLLLYFRSPLLLCFSFPFPIVFKSSLFDHCRRRVSCLFAVPTSTALYFTGAPSVSPPRWSGPMYLTDPRPRPIAYCTWSRLVHGGLPTRRTPGYPRRFFRKSSRVSAQTGAPRWCSREGSQFIVCSHESVPRGLPSSCTSSSLSS